MFEQLFLESNIAPQKLTRCTVFIKNSLTPRNTDMNDMNAVYVFAQDYRKHILDNGEKPNSFIAHERINEGYMLSKDMLVIPGNLGYSIWGYDKDDVRHLIQNAHIQKLYFDGNKFMAKFVFTEMKKR